MGLYTQDALKRRAAEAAVALVEPGMIVGLGFGSTATIAVRRIASLYAEGALPGMVGVPCAEGTARLARELGIPLVELDDVEAVDLTIDGADEVDPALNVIKGGGGALLREKMVAQASRRELIIVDASKLSPALGTRWPVPVEVVEFGWRASARWIAELGAEVALRHTPAGKVLRTDQGNLILDCRFGPISDLHALAATLNARAGIVEHGLFLGLVTDLIVADQEGVRHISKDRV